MTVAGIVAEYNPFHTGHAYQIAQTRERLGQETGIVAVMSGNWVQQANCAILDKWTRAQLALMGGVDLVLELPTVWAVSSAEAFARGAVSILNVTGVVDKISFGSECGAMQPLEALASCLDSQAYESGLAAFLNEGMTFAAARQRTVQTLLGTQAELLAQPNNNLGVEYIRGLRALDSAISPMTILRQGSAHNSVAPTHQRPQFVSATQIRGHLLRGEWDETGDYLVKGGRALMQRDPNGLPNLERVERSMLARIRTMQAEDWAKLPDGGEAEGLPQRLGWAGRQATSMEEFFNLAKTKRYTHARLRRLVLWAWLGLDAEDMPGCPPYIRVLGFNDRGRTLLRQMKEQATVPVLTKPAHAKELDAVGQRLFQREAQCTDLYDLCFEEILPPGREWTRGPAMQPLIQTEQ